MSQQVASLYAEIGAKIDGFQKGAKTVKTEMGSMSSQFSSLIPASVAQFATLGGAIAGVGAALYAMEKAADEAARGDARLEAILHSTGEAAGYNFQQLDTMAQSLSNVTGVDDDLIKKSMAVEATFTNISGNIFPAAAKAALDLSAVLGTDLQGATIQVDKALNDFSGYTALKRAGVSFSEEQVKEIKHFKETNDLAGYQKLVLKELTKEFGGAAMAIHNAGDKSEDLENAWGNLTEQAGGGLVPTMRNVNVFFAESIKGWDRFLQGLQRGDTELSKTINNLVDLGFALAGPIGWYAKYVQQTGEAMDAQNVMAQSIDNATGSIDDQEHAISNYVPSAEEMERINKDISDVNIAMVGTIQSMQDAEDRFTEKSLSLHNDRLEAEQALRDALASGHEVTIEEYNDLQGKIDEVRQKEADLAVERDKQTLQFISNILLQKLEMDGFTTAEFDAFAKQQEAWGLWSADTVAKAKAAWMEADKVAASVNAIPTEHVTTIKINTTGGVGDQPYGPPNPFDEYGRMTNDPGNVNLGGPGGNGLPPGLTQAQWDDAMSWQHNWANGQGTGPTHANGGSFMIPSSYGNEGFRMGNRDTASGGELITITPRNQANQQMIFDYDRMAKATALAVRDALLSMGK